MSQTILYGDMDSTGCGQEIVRVSLEDVDLGLLVLLSEA